MTELQRDVYFAALMTAAVATALLITPSAFRRLRLGQRDRAHPLRVANRFTMPTVHRITETAGEPG